MVKIIIFSVYLYHAPPCMWIIGVVVVDSIIIDVAVYLYSVQRLYERNRQFFSQTFFV